MRGNRIVMDFFLLLVFIIFLMSLKFVKVDLDGALSKTQTTCINGIFTLLILASHFYLEFSTDIWKDMPRTQFYPLIRGWIGQLVVVSFLFYSGYGVAEQIKTKKEKYIIDFPKKRVFKVWMHYVLAILLFCIVNIILNNHYNIYTIILSFFAFESIGNSNWYVFTILVCYIITYFSFKYFKEKYIYISFFLLIIYSILMYIFKSACWYNTVFVYPLGMIISKYKDYIIHFFKKKSKYYAVFFTCIVITFILWIYVIIHGENDIIFMFLACFFAFDILFFTMLFKIENFIFYFFGKYSFEIYILQRIPVLLLKYSFSNKLICFAFVLIFTTFIAIPFNKLEKWLDSKILV